MRLLPCLKRGLDNKIQMPPSSSPFNSSPGNSTPAEVNETSHSTHVVKKIIEGILPIYTHKNLGIESLLSFLDKECNKRESLEHSILSHPQTTLSGQNSARQVASAHCQSNFWTNLQHGMASVDGRDDIPNDSGFVDSSGGPSRSVSYDSRNDLEKLEKNSQELSQCCFYYGSIDSQTSKDLLRKKPTGTFLIRDSSQSLYLFSLSVKTERGATSVRILYNNGLFQFDSDVHVRKKLPQFDSVLGLLDFHVKVTQDGSNKSWQWEEAPGGKSMKVTLKKPLMCSVPSLSHLSRVKINQCLGNSYLSQQVEKLPLISEEAKNFLTDYPYRV